jgi:hypothetical protein
LQQALQLGLHAAKKKFKKNPVSGRRIGNLASRELTAADRKSRCSFVNGLRFLVLPALGFLASVCNVWAKVVVVDRHLEQSAIEGASGLYKLDHCALAKDVLRGGILDRRHVVFSYSYATSSAANALL